MDEQVARKQAHDFIGRNPGVGTSDPKELGHLLQKEPAEEARMLMLHPVCPLPIVGKQFADWPHAANMPQPVRLSAALGPAVLLVASPGERYTPAVLAARYFATERGRKRAMFAVSSE